MTKRQKVWDVTSPFVMMMLMVVIAELAVTIIASAAVGAAPVQEGRIRFLPLLASLVLYLGTILIFQKYYHIDNMRFGTDLIRPRAEHLIPALLMTVPAADLLTRAIELLKLEKIFPAYSMMSALAFRDQNIAFLLLVTVVAGPLAEEMIFRGGTCRRAAFHFGPKRGVLISAGLFGLYHMNMIQFIHAFCMGVLFAIVYQLSESIAVPVVCHMAVNLYAIFRSRPIQEQLGYRIPGGKLLTAAEAFLFCLGLAMTVRKRKMRRESGDGRAEEKTS